MNSSILPLSEIVKLNTRLFMNSFENVDDEVSETRISQKTNSMKFIACHLIDARYYLANFIGINTQCPFKELFDQAKGIDDFSNYPALDDLKSAWLDVSQEITDRLPKLEEGDLKKKSPQSFPIDDQTVLGGIAFLVEHESTHIGQLGFLRKYLGLDALKYS